MYRDEIGLNQSFLKLIAGAVVVAGTLCTGSAWSAPIVFSGSGAAATTALNDFRTAIGGVKNTAAPQATGRREINWDGVKLDGTDVNPNTQVVDANKPLSSPSTAFRIRARYLPIRMR